MIWVISILALPFAILYFFAEGPQIATLDLKKQPGEIPRLFICLFCDYSIAIVFFSGRAFFSFFGINSFNTPCWNDALTSSSVISSPT